MAATSPSNPKPSGDHKSSGENPVPLTFEEKLHHFWKHNQVTVIALCAIVLVAILGKGMWEHMQKQKEAGIKAAYAAATTPDQLRAFASSHPGHELAGIAELRIADEAYTAGKYADAETAYDKAISTLKTGPLVSRAKLGRALSKVQNGKASEATSELKQLADDAGLLNAIRSEAAYQLASLAATDGNSADVQKYIDQLNQIDPASMWARRALALQANLPRVATPQAAPATTPAASAANAPAATEKSGPTIDLNLPKK
jgi:predicted negative regulator of RcsB-dependent stress response